MAETPAVRAKDHFCSGEKYFFSGGKTFFSGGNFRSAGAEIIFSSLIKTCR